jgi:hypothetical protein
VSRSRTWVVFGFKKKNSCFFANKNETLWKVWWFKLVILATQEVKFGRITVQSHLGQKVHETLSQPMAGTVAYTCPPSYMGKHKYEDPGPGQPGLK